MQEADDLALLIDAARASGDIARKFFGNGPETWDKSGGAGPVTEADIAIDRMLLAELTAARPDYGWLSEETLDTAHRLEKKRVFVVDPIDGTRAFVAGEKTFSHALAIVEDGVAIAGVVYLPMYDRMFAARIGNGATLNGNPIHPSMRPDLDGAQVLGTKANFRDEHWQDGLPPITRHFRSSLAFRMALVAEGRFDAMLTLRPSWEWDIAAGTIITQEAGGTATDRAGQPLRFNNPHPQTNGVLAAGPVIHNALLSRLKPAP